MCPPDTENACLLYQLLEKWYGYCFQSFSSIPWCFFRAQGNQPLIASNSSGGRCCSGHRYGDPAQPSSSNTFFKVSRIYLPLLKSFSSDRNFSQSSKRMIFRLIIVVVSSGTLTAVLVTIVLILVRQHNLYNLEPSPTNCSYSLLSFRIPCITACSSFCSAACISVPSSQTWTRGNLSGEPERFTHSPNLRRLHQAPVAETP